MEAQAPKPVLPAKTGITGDFAAGPASGDSGPGLAGATGFHTSGLGYGGMFLLWQGETWSGQVSRTERDICFHVAGMDGGEGGRQLCNDLTPSGRGTSLDGKRRLIRGGGSATRISNETRPHDPFVVKCSSLPSGMWPWCSRCFKRHYGRRDYGLIR